MHLHFASQVPFLQISQGHQGKSDMFTWHFVLLHQMCFALLPRGGTEAGVCHTQAIYKPQATGACILQELRSSSMPTKELVLVYNISQRPTKRRLFCCIRLFLCHTQLTYKPQANGPCVITKALLFVNAIKESRFLLCTTSPRP